MSKAYRRW